MKNYFIAGGAGFIGSNLTKRLLISKVNRVICIDNLLTGSKKNIKEFFQNPNYKFIKHDIIKPLKINIKIDYVLNFASPASPIDYRKFPIKTLETGSAGTKNLLEIAKKNHARFFHSSTSEVYGDPQNHPQKESYWGNVNCYGERACYDEAKRYAEALIYFYKHDFKVNTGIIRIFNSYGPNMRPNDGRVISNFIRQALLGEDLTVYGEGKQTRSFCYVDDQLDALLRMIHSKLEGPINVGNPTEFTILDLAKKIIKLTGSKSRIGYRDLPSDDPAQRRPDITKAKKLLGWKPKIKLEEGLKRTIAWFKESHPERNR